MNLKKRILIQTLSASVLLTLVLGAIFFFSVAKIRTSVLANSSHLGNSAADISGYALEVQLTEKINRIAQDSALILDERLSKIESHTRMTADITGSLYSFSRRWSFQPLPRVRAGEIPPPEPHLYLEPGADYSRIRAEAELAGNINEMLRQITVVDRGIATSAICGESGYVIAMDAFPWPLTDHFPENSGWYQKAMSSNGLYWTDVYEDQRGRGPVITCAVPFYDSSGGSPAARGVAQSTVLLSELSRMIDSTGIGRSGQLFILNSGGVKIYSSDGADITLGEGGGVKGENFLESSSRRVRSLALSMTLGASGMTELEIDRLPVYVAYAPVQTLGWSLGVAVSVQEVSAMTMLIENQIWRITDNTKAEMDRYMLLLAGLMAFLLVLTLLGITFFAIRFTQAITGPILALNNGVHEVAGGNLEREVTIKTGDELEQLAVSFNIMTSQLRKHINEIARVTAERQRIDTELDIATRIQMGMLPDGFPPFRGRKNEFDLYAEVHPAKEVGGDFYDFFFVDDDHFAMVIADVSGKGIPAALFMTITKTIIKNRLQSGEDPELSMEIINKQLCGNNIIDMFVTVWLCVLEISSGRLVYVNAGHNPPLVKRDGQAPAFLVSSPDLVLAGMEDTRYHSRRILLKPNDLLFLYTDGVVEAADSGGVLYGRERLRDFLDANSGLPLRELLSRLRSDLNGFASGAEQSDDITMLAIRILGDEESPRHSAVTIRADIVDLEKLTAFIGRELEGTGCPVRERRQIELAAEEVFVNIASYGYGGGESGGLLLPENPADDGAAGEVVVESVIRPAPGGMMMTLVFTDRGRPFDPLEHIGPDITLPLEEREVGGLGLLIVRKIVDTMHYSRENEANRFEFSKSWQKEKQ